jgi:hypothetical protein
MAGLNIVLNDKQLISQKQKVIKVQSKLNLDNCFSKIIVNSENRFIGWNQYENYPINHYITEDYEIIIEGRVYN